ncbi:RipA family octameric membrane protein [Blautia sp. AM47-4]|uniref:RipA family octameric membrane protein n=1 Tax=unclassified Blautia TaxID=2648079 RepID=UPI003FA41C30
MGVAICILWICTINSYRKLNSVKYEIINEMELKLPLAPFTVEWDRLNKKYE